MKVLVVDNSPAMGGSVHQLASQVRSLAPLGVKYRIIASDPALFAGIVPDVVPVRGLSAPAFRNVFTLTGALQRDVLPGVFNKPFSLLAYRRFFRAVVPEFLSIVTDFEPDLVHLNNLNLPNMVFADALLRFGTPLVLSALMIRLFARAEAAFASRAGAIACVSNAVAKYISETMPAVPSDRLFVVESAIDVKTYDVPRDPAVRAEFGIPADAPLVLSLGRMIPWKGHDILIRALGRVRGAWLLQAGGEEPAWRAQIDRIVAESKMTGRVIFAGVRSDVPRLLAASDLLAHSSKFGRPEDGVVEAFGRVIAEGMAAGIPVVATRAGGATEILEGTEAGRLVRPGDVEDMAQAIRFYLENMNAARRAGMAGREAAGRFDESALAAKLMNVYQKTVLRKYSK